MHTDILNVEPDWNEFSFETASALFSDIASICTQLYAWLTRCFTFCCGRLQLELRVIRPTGNQTIFQLNRTVILLRFINERFKPLLASHCDVPATQNGLKHFSPLYFLVSCLLYLPAASSYLSANCRPIVSRVSSVTGCTRLQVEESEFGLTRSAEVCLTHSRNYPIWILCGSSIFPPVCVCVCALRQYTQTNYVSKPLRLTPISFPLIYRNLLVLPHSALHTHSRIYLFLSVISKYHKL
jgi:hypothetical protein